MVMMLGPVVSLGFFVWSVFSPAIAAYCYLGFSVFLVAVVVFFDRSARPTPNAAMWTPEEIRLWKKYHLAIRYPLGSRVWSGYFDGTRLLLIFIWVPWLLWSRLWIPAILSLVYYLAVGPVVLRLSPFFYLSDAVKRGKHQCLEELSLLEGTHEKWTAMTEDGLRLHDDECPPDPLTGPHRQERLTLEAITVYKDRLKRWWNTSDSIERKKLWKSLRYYCPVCDKVVTWRDRFRLLAVITENRRALWECKRCSTSLLSCNPLVGVFSMYLDDTKQENLVGASKPLGDLGGLLVLARFDCDHAGLELAEVAAHGTADD